MGNMYASLFDVKNNSLADILEQKEKFFRKKTEVVDIPKGFYDMAFVKDNGNHTLITF
jgi:hypothetical protein